MCEWQEFREYQQSMRKKGRFPKYRERVQKRLTRHGFERPFQLDEDLDQQDKLATWIEFLNYEYQDYDKHMRFVERHQAEYDAAWKELVDSQVLRPFETEEFIIYDPKSAVQHANERERAEKAVQSAKSAVVSAENNNPDPRHAHLSQQATRQQRLVAAQSQLAAAIKSLASIKRRNDLIYKFLQKTKLHQVTEDKLKKGYAYVKQSYVGAKRDAERRSILLRWILQQIPFIEIELNQAKMAENHSGGEDGRHRLKRNPTGDLNEERVSKRRREDGGNGALSSQRMRAPSAPTTSQDSSSTQQAPETAGHGEQLKRNCLSETDVGRTTKRRRYSGKTSEPSNSIAQVPQEARKSRRTAGHLPEFGMLPKRGEPAPPYEPPMRRPSNTRKPNPSSPRSHASSKKKSIAVKGAKPQGISKSRREETRSKKRSGR
jgi:hypothetical protein